MEQKKLTFEEIADILKNNISLELFATGETYIKETDEYFQYPENIQNHLDVVAYDIKRKDLNERLYAHPSYAKNWRDRQNDADYVLIQTELNEMPFKNDLLFSLYMEHELGLGKVEQVKQYGGSDQGTTWYVVKYFVDHDVYIRVDGYYSSYEGIDFNTSENKPFGYQVDPIERTVVFYEPTKK